MTDKRPRRPKVIVKPDGLHSFEVVPVPPKNEPIRKTMMLIGPFDEEVAVDLQQHQDKLMAVISGMLDQGDSSFAGEGRFFQLSVPEEDLANIAKKNAKGKGKGDLPHLKVRIRPG